MLPLQGIDNPEGVLYHSPGACPWESIRLPLRCGRSPPHTPICTSSANTCRWHEIGVHPMFIRWDCLIFPTLIPLSIRALHAHIDNRKAVSARLPSGWRIYLSPLRRITQTFVLRLHHRPTSLSLRLRLPPARKRGSLPLNPRVFPMV